MPPSPIRIKHQSQWRLNPFLYKDTRLVRRKGMGDLVNAAERLALSKDGMAERHDQR